MQNLPNEELIKNYLLGDLSEYEESAIQERLFTDENFFEELLIIKDELAEDYAFGLLSAREQERVKKYLQGSPELRRKLEIARALETYASESAGASKSAPGWVALPYWPKPSHPLVLRILSKILPRRHRQKKTSTKEDVARQADAGWESLLAEAHANRNILDALAEGEWLGLHLLARLRVAPASTAEGLADKVGAARVAVPPLLAQLEECGLVERRAGKFSCTRLGAEMLERAEQVSGETLNP